MGGASVAQLNFFMFKQEVISTCHCASFSHAFHCIITIRINLGFNFLVGIIFLKGAILLPPCFIGSKVYVDSVITLVGLVVLQASCVGGK